MKTVLIERVRNGWLVRPFNTNHCLDSVCRGDAKDVYVYRKMEDLQQDLPMLCEWSPRSLELPSIPANEIDACPIP